MMKQEDLLKKTGAILNELQEQYQFMIADSQSLNELELELFLANANFLTEHVQILKRISMHKPVKALPEHAEHAPGEADNAAPTKVFDDFFTPDKETPTFEFIVNDRANQPTFVAESTSQVIEPMVPPVPEEIPVEEPEEAPFEEPYEPYIEPEEAPIEEPLEAPVTANPHIHPVYSNMDIANIPSEQFADDEPLPVESNAMELIEEEEDEVGPEPFLVERATEEEPIITEPAAVATPVFTATPEPVIPIISMPVDEEEPILQEKPVEQPKHQPTLNELLAASRTASSKSPENESSKPAITDLRRAINLNEKLLFVKDLFDGYNLAYAEAIDLVNKMPDFNTADLFLKKHYATKHNWASKPSTVEQFYELLHQRFPK